MAKKFIVDVKHGRPKRTLVGSSRMSSILVMSSCMAVIITTQYLKDKRFIASLITAVAGGVAVLLFIGIISSRGDEGLEISLTVNPLSVQIATSRRGKRIGYPVLICRKDIVDIVVNELVLSHKVVSVVVLRIKASGHTGFALQDRNREIPVPTLLKQGNLRLQVAFPGVEMSYRECMAMRQEICKALDYFRVQN